MGITWKLNKSEKDNTKLCFDYSQHQLIEAMLKRELINSNIQKKYTLFSWEICARGASPYLYFLISTLIIFLWA